MNAPHTRRWLVLLLLISFGLRVWLACLGGQGYWADEARYVSSRTAVYDVRHGDWRGAGQELLGHADHTLFRWFGLPPALVESLVGHNLPAFVAAYFGLFSVLTIFLIWAIARRAGGGEAEALWAAYLAACANSLFYYSRHFFPYDVAISVILAGLWLGMGRWSWRNSLWVGVAASIGFLTYNGYWLLGGCVLILHALLGDGGRGRILARAAWSAAGLVLPIVVLAGLGAALGYNLVSEDYQWGIIAKGDFPFGHRVFAGYLWYGEGGSLVIWVVALAYALARACRDRRWGRLAWHAGAVILVTGGLLGLSDLIREFTVQGRRVREVVPFLCLGAAVGITEFVQSRGAGRRRWATAIALLVGACAAWNFSVPLRQVFPDGFRQLAAAAIARQSDASAYRLTFVRNLWGVDLDGLPSPFPTILRRPHPMQYRPYQYEGYDKAQRADLNAHDITMRLIRIPGRLDAADPRWRGYPGPMRLVVRFPGNAAGSSEPLAVAGRTGHGEIFYVHYVDATHVAFGLDHWGLGARSSAPIEVDYRQPHEIILLAGFLLPPPEQTQDARFPELSLQRDHLLVLLDGRPVFSLADPFCEVPRAAIWFGVDSIGGSTNQTSFSGDILEFGVAPASALAAALSLLESGQTAAKLASQRPRAWQGALGPVRLRFGLPALGTPGSQPLLSAGDSGAGGLLFLRREDQDHVRVGFREGGQKAMLSESLLVDPAAPQELDVSLGSMMPPDDGVIYATDANLGALRNLLYVRLNGETVLKARRSFSPVLGRVAFGLNLVGDQETSLAFQGALAPVEALATSDIPALLYVAEAVPATDAGWGGYPGPIRLRVVFPQGPAAQEPLVVSGVTGAADFLYVRYDDERHVLVGFDHWGGGGAVSAPVSVEPGAAQEFVISMGSLLPSADEIYRRNPALARLRGRLFVSLNGKTLLDAPMEFHATRLDQLLIGSNLVGGSTAAPSFKGRILSVARVPAAQIPDPPAPVPGH